MTVIDQWLICSDLAGLQTVRVGLTVGLTALWHGQKSAQLIRRVPCKNSWSFSPVSTISVLAGLRVRSLPVGYRARNLTAGLLVLPGLLVQSLPVRYHA
ncbi:MAG TPA: hypothetical protein DCG78_00260 [Anaerolineaceae bacterium]|nr:hypothetical protein [Anaerolineaceae bacterium]